MCANMFVSCFLFLFVFSSEIVALHVSYLCVCVFACIGGVLAIFAQRPIHHSIDCIYGFFRFAGRSQIMTTFGIGFHSLCLSICVQLNDVFQFAGLNTRARAVSKFILHSGHVHLELARPYRVVRPYTIHTHTWTSFHYYRVVDRRNRTCCLTAWKPHQIRFQQKEKKTNRNSKWRKTNFDDSMLSVMDILRNNRR